MTNIIPFPDPVISEEQVDPELVEIYAALIHAGKYERKE